ncbi:MAG TPA: low temperature requirement protein A [Aeromicrobium sp.]|nr:low temperature requirement protein A [Aeromicrobium sp.]
MASTFALGPRDPREEHRTASPLELFTDLCYVVAIAQAASQLHHAIVENHVVAGVGYFGIAFFAIWLAWLNFAWFNSAYDADDVIHRILTLLQVFGSLVLAAGVPRIFEGDFMLAIAGYVIMRIGLVLMWIRAAQGHPERRATAIRYAVGLTGVQAAWVASAVVTRGDIPLALFIALAVIDLAVPVVAEAAGSTPWHPHHIAERYGLMFIIVLGEAVLASTFALQDAFDAEHPPASLWLVVVGGVLIIFCAWWLYFAREASDVIHHDRSGFVWGFGHYLVYAAVAALGAGLAVRVDFHTHQAHVGPWVSSLAVTAPAALFILALWFTQVRPHDGSVRIAALFGGAAVLVLVLTWLPAAEPWVGLIFVLLLITEASRRQRVAYANSGVGPGT